MTRPRGLCSSCHTPHLVRDDGTIGRHVHMSTRSPNQLYCAGTGKPPIQDDPPEEAAVTTPDTTSTGCGHPMIEVRNSRPKRSATWQVVYLTANTAPQVAAWLHREHGIRASVWAGWFTAVTGSYEHRFELSGPCWLAVSEDGRLKRLTNEVYRDFWETETTTEYTTTPTAQRPESHDNAGGPGVLPVETLDRPDGAQPTVRFEPNPFRAGFAALAVEADRVRAEAKRRYNHAIARNGWGRP